MRNTLIIIMIHMLFLVGCEKQHDANIPISNVEMKEHIASMKMTGV